jgi:hypothetical protein
MSLRKGKVVDPGEMAEMEETWKYGIVVVGGGGRKRVRGSLEGW